ncbi:hypothetical protein LCGC14_0592590 [marine sediment metagenome]|uniref:Uncharacterized protein n=1 Tax=marine sediment metagenome TaxID=412755 RepID=A0A0F9ULF3_9ZZZZ
MAIIDALKAFIDLKTMPLACYLAIGFLLSQFSNIHLYTSSGATTLMTWYKMAGLTTREPRILLISQLCVIMAVVVFLSFQLFSHYAKEWTSLEVLHRSAILFGCLILISQALFSSVMRISYETLFCLVAISAMVLAQAFLRSPHTGIILASPEYKELLDLLKFIIPLCLGIPILMGGAGFITSFYQSEQGMIRLQLYRHILMAIYFELGATLFLIYPILRRILLVRGR